LLQSDIVSHPKAGAYKRRAGRIHSEESTFNDATNVCQSWYRSARVGLVNPLTVSIPSGAQTQKGQETTKTSAGVIARQSALLAGAIRHTDRSVRDEVGRRIVVGWARPGAVDRGPWRYRDDPLRQPYRHPCGRQGRRSRADRLGQARLPYLDPETPVLAAVLQRAKSDRVDLVMVAGEVVYEGGRFIRVDRAAALRDLHESLHHALGDDEIERRALSKGLLPHVRHFYDGIRIRNPPPLLPPKLAGLRRRAPRSISRDQEPAPKGAPVFTWQRAATAKLTKLHDRRRRHHRRCQPAGRSG